MTISIILPLFTVTLIIVAVVVRKRKTLAFYLIAAGLAITIAFLGLLYRAIKFTM